MKSFDTVDVKQDGGVRTIAMNRPEVHNAFNEHLLADLLEAFKDVEAAVTGKKSEAAGESPPRVAVLTGRGKSFSAGADLKWMGKMRDYSFEENLEDALVVADLMALIHTCPIPTVARVNGAAIGGGVGLLAACDLVVASHKAFFSLSEVKLGLVPACIAPFVIRRIGQRAAREYFLTGERFGPNRAREIGLVNRVSARDDLDQDIDALTKRLISSGPEALRMAKELIREVPDMTAAEYRTYTAEMIARLRVSEEGQEGIRAFFEKRRPAWAQEDEPE